MSPVIKLACLAICSHFVSRATSQLVVPSAVPEMGDNWKLVAAVTGDTKNPLHLDIQNREVGFARSQACSKSAVLVDAGDERALTFHLDREERTMMTEHDAHNLTVGIPSSTATSSAAGNGHPLRLDCGKGTAGLEIEVNKTGPRVSYNGTDLFYVCKTTIQKHATTQIFFHSDESVPDECVGIVLVPKCTKGPDRGNDNLGYCCSKVRDGECLDDETWA